MSIDMLRAVAISIVLALATGPNASLLCSTWCHQAATAGCEHRDTTGAQTIATDDACPMTVGIATAYVRDDVRRGASTPQAQHGKNVTPFESGLPPIEAVSASLVGLCTPLAARPPVLSLRI